MELIRHDVNLPFAKWWKPFAIVSFSIVGASILLLIMQIFVWKNFNWGTDFSGGTEMQILFVQPQDMGKLREVLGQAGFPKAEVTRLGGDQNVREFLVRVEETSEQGVNASQKIMQALTAQFGADGVTLQRVDEVGARVGSDLKVSGIVSVILALLGIYLYVWIRFTPKYAPGAIISLLHDVIISLGFYALMKRPFELPTVAAILTIIGYSINDTIVIYDRLRERLKQARHGMLSEIIEKSLNETLSRTIMTSFVTFLVVLAQFFLTSGSISNFALMMMMGIFVGTYSSIFVATPVMVWLENMKAAKNQKASKAR